MNILIGLSLLARGRGEGIAQFGDSVSALLSSLAPLLALSFVISIVVLITGKPLTALALFLVLMIAQLAPMVISHLIAARWGREEDWLRYATAANWCQLLLPVVFIGLLVVAQVAMALGAPLMPLVTAILVVAEGYMLWLAWIVARHGLDLSRGRAVLLVILVTVGTDALATVPSLIAG